VPKEFWEAWLAKHKEMPFIRNGAVFAARSESDAAAEADQRSGDRTGFEGAEPGDVDRRIAELARE
ncbi:MAG TPA: hypothetical protein PLD10_20540, partial [Rhodopila sp.]|nr:hypothetical protein [Rhodopila sp.]